MVYDFIIFGGTGQQGRICTRDLLECGYSCLIIGRNKEAVKKILKNKKTGFLNLDLKNEKDIEKAIYLSGAKVVVNCAELVFNLPIMKACLKTGKSLTDLGGLQKITMEQFKLDNSFEKKKILCITGCGSTPGISNIMARYAVKHFDNVDTINLGFAWKSNIKKFVIPYSMHSIFDELTNDAVTFHEGKFVKEKRFKCQGTFDFKEIGKQTAYCIVHSEVYTFPKYFKDKNLKAIHYMAGFPDHSYSVIKNLIDLGFSSKEEIEIAKAKIKPADFTDKILSKINIPKGYKEVENIWVNVYGKKNSESSKMDMNCIVKTIDGWEDAGSNIDTGRTISIISQMLFNDKIKFYGVHAPEGVVNEKDFFEELARRKMWVYENERRIN